MSKKVLAILLAGGASRRMGKDKTQLIAHHQTLLSHTQQMLNNTAVNQVIISGPQLGALPDITPGAGPAKAAIDIIQLPHIYDCFDYALIMPVDMPLFPAKLINLLIQHVHQHRSCYFRSYNLPALINIHHLKNLHLTDTLHMSFFQMLELLNAHGITVHQDQHSLFSNINTPKQYQQYRQSQ